jgi:hypothetical protein
MRNFPTVKMLSKGFNYSLKHNQPYSPRIHSDRLIAVGRYLSGVPAAQVAEEAGCCVTSIKNWTKTFEKEVARLDG